MKILYNSQDGKIFHVVYDVDWFKFSHTTRIPLLTLHIDEVDPQNKDVCKDVQKNLNKIDINGNPKHYIQNGELYEVDNWEEYNEDYI